MSHFGRLIGSFLVLQSFCLAAAAADGDTMFDETTYKSLVAESKAVRVGDILTVVVQENASASSTADSSAQRNTNLKAEAGTSKTGVHSATVGVGTDSDGGGKTQRSGRLLAQLSVRVVSLNPNGDLVVAGQQSLQINGEEQTITLSGVVRPRDIAESNTVLSSRIADARVQFKGQGFVSDKSQPGWLSRLFAALGL